MTHALPETIRDTDHLEDLLSEPTDGVVETLKAISKLIMSEVKNKIG